jgi:hypothetical protein
MMEEPGSFSGMINSPIPERGPEAKHTDIVNFFV